MAEASPLFVIVALKRNSGVATSRRNTGKLDGTRLAMIQGTTSMSRILFVSQNGDLRAASARVLGRAGWDVTTAAHGGHASLACVEGPPFDVLVVVEGETNGADGSTLAIRLRRYCPALRLVTMPARPFTADELLDGVLREASALATAYRLRFETVRPVKRADAAP
jgi:CheY-like chemotaxis protein